MSVSVVNKGNLNDDQEDVLERFIEFQYAMIEKDLEKLNELLKDNYTLSICLERHRQRLNILMR